VLFVSTIEIAVRCVQDTHTHTHTHTHTALRHITLEITAMYWTYVYLLTGRKIWNVYFGIS